MVKKIIGLSVCIGICMGLYAQGIRFENELTWQQIRSKAKAENKYVFMDVMATWCGPCKEMSKDVFTDIKLQKVTNDNYIALQVQADRTNSDAPNVRTWYNDAAQIIQQYQVVAYPTMLIFSPGGTLVNRLEGFRDVSQMATEFENSKLKVNQYPYMLQQYKKGRREVGFIDTLVAKSRVMKDSSTTEKMSNEFLAKSSDQVLAGKAGWDLVNVLKLYSESKEDGFAFPALTNRYEKLLATYKSGKANEYAKKSLAVLAKVLNKKDIAGKVSEEFIASLKEPEVFEKNNIEFIKEFTSKINDKGFAIFYDNASKINSITGPHYVEEALGWILNRDVFKPATENRVAPNWDSLRNIMTGNYGEIGKEEYLRSKMYFETTKEWKDIIPEALEYYSNYYQYEKGAMNMNNAAWAIFEHRTDKKELEEALKWSERVIELEPTANYYDTYANLLYKLGRKEEAIRAEEKGLTLKPGNGTIESIKTNLEKIKRGEKTW